MKKKIILGLLTIFGIVSLAACGQKLSGTYSAKINLILVESEASYVFKGDKVTEKADGEVQDEGTYEIDDNKLTMTFSEDKVLTAKLSKDKNSFEADDLGIKFTKEKK